MWRATAILALCLLTREVLACECATAPIDHEFATADAVFEGEVLSSGVEIVVRVTRDWKGKSSSTVRLRNMLSNCAVDFKPGERRLFFPKRWRDGRDWVDLTMCDRHPLLGSEEYREARARLVELTSPERKR